MLDLFVSPLLLPAGASLAVPDWEAIAVFSRVHCAGICAALVPGMVLLTALTLWWTWRDRRWRYGSSLLAGLTALAMVAHVGTWFVAGVVSPVTFMLLGLVLLCLGQVATALAMPQVVQRVGRFGRDWLQARQLLEV